MYGQIDTNQLTHLATAHGTNVLLTATNIKKKKRKRKVQEVPQSQTAAFPRHQEEEVNVLCTGIFFAYILSLHVKLLICD